MTVNPLANTAEPSGFRKFIRADKTQRVLLIVSFMFVPLILLLMFTYVPFLKMVQFSFYNRNYLSEGTWVGLACAMVIVLLVYTPLNGSGLECVKKLLAKLGVTHVTVVPEQEKPDGISPPALTPTPRSARLCRRAWNCATKSSPTCCWAPTPTATAAAPPSPTARAATA